MQLSTTLQDFVARAAGLLGVPSWQLSEDGQGVIDEVLTYFETGALRHPFSGDAPFPRFVLPRLLAVGDTLLAVRTVQESHHPIVPTVREAYVVFDVEDQEAEVPPWLVINSEESLPSHGNVAYTFTSAVPTNFNLKEFAEFVLSPAPESEGTAALLQWMARHPPGRGGSNSFAGE